MTLSAVRTTQFVPQGDFDTEVVPIKTWAISTAYKLGEIVRSSAASGNYYQCTVAGTSDTAAPTWTITGTTVTDNSVTWQDIGAGYAGDLVKRPNGLIAYIDGIQPLDQQSVISFRYVRVGFVPKATGTLFVDGASVWFNTATSLCVTSAPGQGFPLGHARGYWGSGKLQVLVALNGTAGLLFSANTLTFSGLTGANVVVFPDALAQGLLVKDGGGNIVITIRSTDGSEAMTFSPGALDTLKLNTASAAVNYVSVTPGATGTGPNIIPASGTDTNIDLILKAAGTGVISIGSATTPAVVTATGKTNTGYLSVLGKTSAGVKLTCADAMGYTLILSAAAVATADRTLTFPDPGGNDSVAYLGLAQAVTGAKTFTNAKVVVTQVTAVGSVASLATNTMAPGFNVVAGGGTDLGVMLPAASAGTIVIVKNNTASAALVYADGIGGTYAICINALATSTGLSVATTKATIFICENATRWFTIPLAIA